VCRLSLHVVYLLSKAACQSMSQHLPRKSGCVVALMAPNSNHLQQQPPCFSVREIMQVFVYRVSALQHHWYWLSVSYTACYLLSPMRYADPKDAAQCDFFFGASLCSRVLGVGQSTAHTYSHAVVAWLRYMSTPGLLQCGELCCCSGVRVAVVQPCRQALVVEFGTEIGCLLTDTSFFFSARTR